MFISKSNNRINFGINSNLSKYPPKINIDKIKSFGINNLRVLDSEVISGSTFESRSLEELSEIKASGIDTIVDFRADGSNVLQKKCEIAGIKYLKFPLDNVLSLNNSDYFKMTKDNKRYVTDGFIDGLKKFFKVMDSGKTYAGCQYGIDRTNVGLSLNYILNPKSKSSAPEILTWPGERKKTVVNKNTKVIKKILKALTPEQKKELGISTENNDDINKKILLLVKKNKQNINTNI